MKLALSLLFSLAGAAAVDDFLPLSCNNPLPSTPCSTWYGAGLSGVASGVTTYDAEVTIPCGECVQLDVSDLLIFEQGLTILGKLVIDGDANMVKIETKFVRVEGELEIISTGPIGEHPHVNITLTGTEDVTFTPADVNSGACGGACGVGKKPVVVAGGKLTIKGMADGVPAWTPLYDVQAGSASTTADLVEFTTFPSDGCNVASDGIIINEDFSDENNIAIRATPGTHFSFVNQLMKLHNRTSHYHGPLIDLKNVRPCIVEDRTYLITFRVRLTMDTDPSGTGLTECALTGTNCLQIKTEWLEEGGDNGMRRSSTKYYERQSHRTEYGDWFIVADEITFSGDNTQPSNIYESIRIQGPGAGISMEIDDLVLRFPPEEAYADPEDACSNLIPGNGDAELLGMSPFPFAQVRSYTDLYVKEDKESPMNHFFVSTARRYAEYTDANDKNEKWDGMAVKIPFGCVRERASYRVKARMRGVPNAAYPDPVPINIRLRAKKTGAHDNTPVIATCPLSNNTWVNCEGIFSFDPGWMKNPIPDYYDVHFHVTETVEYHLDYITVEAESGPIKNIVVDQSVNPSWAPGAEVLLTTHLASSDKHQVRTITSVVPSSNDSYVVLELDEAINRPSTVKDNPLYATEVALLNRNILFVAKADDLNPKHGGHMIIFHTPNINQQIEGVEVRNFGQAGNLGRYPIHFHLSGDNEGSVVNRNLIRESNQRCVVIHGTHNVTIQENVAFDTFGHCYLLEDGFETGNTFRKNLGAFTKNQPLDDIIPPIDGQNNGEETDGNSATFWITNPENKFVDNVAAGCQVNGFWFELDNKVRGPMSGLYDFNPKTLSLGQFEGNVAHGCNRGFRTYPNGYVPDEKAVFYDLLAYRNRGDGFFFHNSENLEVRNGLFADNRKGIDIDRCDNMTVDSTEIIGVTDDYRSIMETQNVDGLCESNSYMVAVEFHLFTRDKNLNGATLRNVSISGLKDTGCEMEVAFRFDDETDMPNFDWWTTTEQMTLEADNEPFYFCQAELVNATNAYITDKDSSLQPATAGFSGTSTFLGDFLHMTTFVDLQTCVDKIEEYCYYYCNTCLRSVEFKFDARNTEGYTLRVCDPNDDSKCIEVDEVFDYANDEAYQMDNFRDYKRRKFSVALPKGSYKAEIFDVNGVTVWPTFVTLTYEDVQCSADALEEGSIELVVPDVTEADCQELVRNGDAEADSTDFKYWVHRNRVGIKVVPGVGLGGSNAFGDIKTGSASSDAIGVFLDTRCIEEMVGREYEIKAYAQLYDKNALPAVEIEYCDPNTENCPEVGLRGDDPYSFTLEPAAKTLKEYTLTDGYQLIWGRVTVTQELADSGSLLLYVERNSANGRLMHVDNVTMELLPSGPTDCEEIIEFNDMETGDSRGWKYDTTVVTPGADGSSFALHMNESKTALQWVKTGCMVQGSRYRVSGKYHLIDRATQTVTDIADLRAVGSYPRMTIRPYMGDEDSSHTAARTVGNTDLDWVEMFGYVTATDVYAGAEKMSIYFSNIPSGYDMVVDNLSIAEAPPDCSQLILNGEMNGYATIWKPLGSGIISNTDSGAAVRISDRTKTWEGLEYETAHGYMDYGCFVANEEWKVTAQIKLVSTVTDSPFMCNMIDNACPDLQVRFQTAEDVANKHYRTQVISTYANDTHWDESGFNLLEGTFSVPADTFPIQRVRVLIRDFPIAADLIVDEVSITRVSA